MEAFRMNGNRPSLEGVVVTINSGNKLIETFEDVKVVLAYSPPKFSGIYINVQEIDKSKYDSLCDIDKFYSKDNVEIQFTDVSDYQFKKGFMDITPLSCKLTLSFIVNYKY